MYNFRLVLTFRQGLLPFSLACLCLFFGSRLLGKSLQTDSLKRVVEAMPLSSEKGGAYLDLATKVIYSDLESALAFSKEGESIARTLKNDSLLGAALFRIGTVFLIEGKMDSTVMYYQETMSIAKRRGDPDMELSVHLNLGNMYMKLGNKEKAEEELLEAKSLINENTHVRNLRVIFNNLGTLALRNDKYQEAFDNFEEAHRHIEAGDRRQLSLSYNNQGDAIKYLREDREFMSYYWKAYEAVKGSSFYQQLANSFENLIDGYTELGELSRAEPLLDSLVLYSNLSNDPWTTAACWSAQTNYYEAAGDYKSAYHIYKKRAAFQDSVATASQNAELAKLTTELKVIARDGEIELLEAKNALERERGLQTQTIAIALAIGLGLLLLAAGALAFALLGRSRTNKLLRENNRVIQEKNELLERQKVVLEDLNREKDGLIGIVAHDLKSPLNKSLALVSVIEQSGELNEAQAKAVSLIRQTNETGTSLIRDLLELNSIEQEKADKELRRLEAKAIFDEIGATFSAEAQRKGIQLDFASPPDGVALETHPLSLFRILENLVSNALKFSRPGTAVQVSAEKEGSQFKLEVRDQGPGISPEDQQKLFGKFQRLSARPTGGESSTGLGLAITKSLVEKLGGMIRVESELGKGTAFVVLLPA